jgi:hypothetical protein
MREFRLSSTDGILGYGFPEVSRENAPVLDLGIPI